MGSRFGLLVPHPEAFLFRGLSPRPGRRDAAGEVSSAVAPTRVLSTARAYRSVWSRPGLTTGQEARVDVVERDVRARCALAVLPGRSKLLPR